MSGPSDKPVAPARILYVDDDATAAASLERMLARLGHQVTGLRSPHEAVARFAATPHDWDLVLTDFRMPELDGVGVAEAVRQRRPRMPMILITGYAGTADLVRAQAIGFSAILPKPSTLAELTAAIRTALGHDSPASP